LLSKRFCCLWEHFTAVTAWQNGCLIRDSYFYEVHYEDAAIRFLECSACVVVRRTHDLLCCPGTKEKQVRVRRARSGKPMHRGQHLRIGFRSLHGGYHQVRQLVQCETANSRRQEQSVLLR
jgi:hypothetical protein